MKKISDKRKRQNDLYHEVKNEFILIHIDNPYDCIFCGKRIYEPTFELHHGSGEKENEHLYKEKHLLFPVHHGCHTDYHSLPIAKITWYKAYIERIKHIPEIIAIETRKMWKAS